MSLGALVGLFGAGLLTFASPCVLPMLPLYVSVLAGAGASADPQQARWRLRLAGVGFALGLAAVFIAMGIGAWALASTLSEYRRPMLVAAGLLLALFGAKLLGVLRFAVLEREARPLLMKALPSGGFGGGVAFGAAFGLGWTPCVGPVLGAALTYSASSSADALTAVVQLGAYALGLALPLVAAAFAADRVLAWTRRLRAAAPVLQKLTGAFMVVTGALLAADRLDALVPRADQTARAAEPASCDSGQEVACAAPAAAESGDALAELPTGAPRFIEFMSSHCPACARMAPVMERLEHACATKPESILRMSLDEARGRELAGRYGVRLLPTFMTVDADGKEVERFVGEHPEAKLAMALESVRGEACVGL